MTKIVLLGDIGDCMVSYMAQMLRNIPIHPSKTRAGGAHSSSRMRRSAPAVAAMLAFLTLAACGVAGGGALCEQHVLERVFFGGITLGYSELARAVDCPGADELNDLKIKAREGDPDAQAAVGSYYFRRISPIHPDRERWARSAAKLLRCAAEGGSHGAQGSFLLLSLYLEQPDAAKVIYKYSKIWIQRAGCDCNALFQNPPWLSLSRSTNRCFRQLCSPMRRAAEKLSPTQITEIEDDISAYEPSPRVCDVEILKE
ncbi:MAG: hypothetical protein IH878_18050 [Gemmatimonadetes bacterium]|nr:hypothetical protein [Gemmatimonadota bacterium]